MGSRGARCFFITAGSSIRAMGPAAEHVASAAAARRMRSTCQLACATDARSVAASNPAFVASAESLLGIGGSCLGRALVDALGGAVGLTKSVPVQHDVASFDEGFGSRPGNDAIVVGRRPSHDRDACNMPLHCAGSTRRA